jgi:hypothetical protein
MHKRPQQIEFRDLLEMGFPYLRRRRAHHSPPAPLTLFLSPAPPTPLLFFKKGGVSLRFSDFMENTEQGFLPSQSDKAMVFLIFRIGRFWMKFRGIEP